MEKAIAICFRVLATAVVVALTSSSLGAQVTETPVAFDSAGRVRSLTSTLAARLDLQAPAWPVTGEFREARLYVISTGGSVLAVERLSGAIDRFILTDDAAAALRRAVTTSLTRTGALVTETQVEVVSEPARGAFVRNQMLMTWSVYGPLLAIMANDSKTAASLYLLATGASYFITNGIARANRVTRAENDLATDGALRGWGIGAGMLYVAAGSRPDYKAYAAAGLAGALGTATYGYRRARSFTDAEAKATTAFSTWGAATALLTLGAANQLDTLNGRWIAGTVLTAGIAGYAWGPRYARQSAYAVTKGDIQVMQLGSALGMMVSMTPWVRDEDVRDELVSASMLLGMLGGGAIAHHVWVRPYDHTTGDALQVGLAAVAGGLVGAGVNVITTPGTQGAFTIVTAGALAGAMVGHNTIVKPARVSVAAAGLEVSARAPLREPRLTWSPAALALAAARVPGLHAALTFRF